MNHNCILTLDPYQFASVAVPGCAERTSTLYCSAVDFVLILFTKQDAMSIAGGVAGDGD